MRYLQNRAKNTILALDMPVRCPEEDPDCTEVRQIRLYVVDRITLWLHIDDVEWAVRYLYVQNLLKGVPLVLDDSIGLSDPRWRSEVTQSAVAERGDPIRGGGGAKVCAMAIGDRVRWVLATR